VIINKDTMLKAMQNSTINFMFSDALSKLITGFVVFFINHLDQFCEPNELEQIKFKESYSA